MSRTVKSVALTDPGKIRPKNEDNFVLASGLWGKPACTLLGAIDGVGGYEGGAEAALIAKQTIESYLQNFSFGEPSQLLKEAIIAANNRIYEQRLNEEKFRNMSCVLSVGIADAQKEMIYIGHVGDSRGYVYRNSKLLKITHDHSTVGAKEDSGYLTEEEAMHHPLRNEISKILGDVQLDAHDSEQFIELAEHSFLPGDIALFCSDGLTDLVTRSQIEAVLATDGSLEFKAQSLIAHANALGGKDNITVALATYAAEGINIASQKEVQESAIEVPIAPEQTPAVDMTELPANPKPTPARTWLIIFIIAAFILGFLANWKGTRQLFSTPPETNNMTPVDSIQSPDTTKRFDTLINATDTIVSSTDSLRLKPDSLRP